MAKVDIKTRHTGDLPGGVVKGTVKAMNRTMERVRESAIEKAPVKSGRLAGKNGGEANVYYVVTLEDDKITAVVTATALNPQTGLDYAGWVHDGTGVHGERGVPIKPKNGKFLVFLADGRPNPTTDAEWETERKNNNVIYAKEVQGQEGQPFLADGLQYAWDNYAQQYFSDEMVALKAES